MKKVLYHRIFEPNPFGHGGERRSAQLYEVLSSWGITMDLFLLKGISGYRKPFWSLWLILKTYGWTLLKHPIRLWKIFRFVSYNYTRNLNAFFNKPEHTIILEGTIEEFQIMFPLANKFGKKVIAIPHNLESLVPKKKYIIGKGEKWSAFKNEICYMQQCKAVFCISREETWLLRLWDINSYFLPYYPAKECEQYLLKLRQIREKRKSNDRITYLMIGSAINGPTAYGMQQVIDFLIEHKQISLKLIVGGYGTDEYLHVNVRDERISILGKLSNDMLSQLQRECDAMLIWQPATTGALTRIQEALIAGIPIVANTESARTYYNTKGIIEINNLGDLENIKLESLQMPEIPLKPQCVELFKMIKN